MNNCSFSGRLTKDPEIKATEGGTVYLKFCLAVKRLVKSGEHPQSDFIDCVAWNRAAEIINSYCKKGSILGVTGRLQTGTYEKNGEKRKTCEVVVNDVDLLDARDKTESAPEATPAEKCAEVGVEPTSSYLLPFDI